MNLTPAMKRLMSPADQARYFGGPDLSLDPIKMSDESLKLERDEQRTFQRELCRRENDGELTFSWQRTDKRATGRTGTLDFAIYGPNGRTLFLEFKLGDGSLSSAQRVQVKRLTALGHSVKVVYSAEQAIKELILWLS